MAAGRKRVRDEEEERRDGLATEQPASASGSQAAASPAARMLAALEATPERCAGVLEVAARTAAVMAAQDPGKEAELRALSEQYCREVAELQATLLAALRTVKRVSAERNGAEER
jgi:hypothetical protein